MSLFKTATTMAPAATGAGIRRALQNVPESHVSCRPTRRRHTPLERFRQAARVPDARAAPSRGSAGASSPADCQPPPGLWPLCSHNASAGWPALLGPALDGHSAQGDTAAARSLRARRGLTRHAVQSRERLPHVRCNALTSRPQTGLERPRFAHACTRRTGRVDVAHPARVASLPTDRSGDRSLSLLAVCRCRHLQARARHGWRSSSRAAFTPPPLASSHMAAENLVLKTNWAIRNAAMSGGRGAGVGRCATRGRQC
jgi:hypothetical protein